MHNYTVDVYFSFWAYSKQYSKTLEKLSGSPHTYTECGYIYSLIIKKAWAMVGLAVMGGC